MAGLFGVFVVGNYLIGGIVLLTSVSWLIERNEFQLIRMLTDSRPQLVLRPSGIDMIQKRKVVFIKWEDVVELRLGVREMDANDENIELYIYTQHQGSMCLPINQLSIESVKSFREKTDAWWGWIKSERLRNLTRRS